jgi:hypothetical protein
MNSLWQVFAEEYVDVRAFGLIYLLHVYIA